jgi:hypothetical protein
MGCVCDAGNGRFEDGAPEQYNPREGCRLSTKGDCPTVASRRKVKGSGSNEGGQDAGEMLVVEWERSG